MPEVLLTFIPQGILWSGYVFLGLLFLGVLRTLLETPIAWENLFSESQGESHHLTRYVLVFGTLALAVKFLAGVLTADSIQEIEGAVQLIRGLGIEEAAGASGLAYLMAKVTNGNILALFGRR
jgi:hypothetical protein